MEGAELHNSLQERVSKGPKDPQIGCTCKRSAQDPQDQVLSTKEIYWLQRVIEGRRKGQTREMSVGGVDKRLSRDKEETDMAHRPMVVYNGTRGKMVL